MKKQDFFEPITRMNLKTFVHQNKVTKVFTSNNKLIKYKQQSQSLEEKISMKELMTYLLTPIPYSIGTADGKLLKTGKLLNTEKSKDLQSLQLSL